MKGSTHGLRTWDRRPLRKSLGVKPGTRRLWDAAKEGDDTKVQAPFESETNHNVFAEAGRRF